MISKKVILTGSFGVGKTSLFNQFLHSRFSEKYLTTIGVKVDKKVINIDGKELSMIIWDIAGEVAQDKVPTTYFLGASGIIYVFDLTRPSTFKNLLPDLEYLQEMTKGAVVKIVGNKKDLVTPEELAKVLEDVPAEVDITTSAKTGENVDHLFHLLGAEIVDWDRYAADRKI